LLQEKSSMRSSKIVERERSIALMITKNRFWSWNKKKMRWTLPLGKSQRNGKINLAIRKHQVFKPCDRKLSRSIKFSSPSSIIPLGLRQVSPIFSHLSHHIFHLGRSPITMRPLHIFSFFHLGRSPITIRPLFFFLWVGHSLQWERTSHFFHLGRSPITTRPLFIFFPPG
jgi:hypothetical protein